jgi:diaminohydroxyphosphoribosylaminopyrimidine deaminase/5-amino-6-(5-phosphoribosylamino)uracil reductase
MKIGVSQLLIEGGGDTIWPFVAANFADELVFFVAPIIIGGREAVPAVGGTGFARIKDALNLKELSVGRIGPDLVIQAKTGTAK